MKRFALVLFVLLSLSGIAYAQNCTCTPASSLGGNVYQGTGSQSACTCLGVATAPAVCGDGTCNGGETCTTCLSDCGACPPVCGNRTCESAQGETCTSCPGDCGTCPPVCGNNSCESANGETCSNCSRDCGACPVICGQYGCQAGESCSSCSRDCGTCNTCLLAGTAVTMADGSTKPIEKIRKGDMVLAFDEKTGEFKPDKVKKLLRHTSDGYLLVNNELKITANHPVYSNGQWTHIGKLAEGDVLFDKDGKSIRIDSKQHIPGKIKTYNIEVNPYHTYIADGYVVHNAAIGSGVGKDPGLNN